MACVIEEMFGIDRGQFTAAYLGQRILLVEAAASTSVLAYLPDADRIVSLLPIYSDRADLVQLASDGNSMPAPRLSGGGLDLEAIWSRYHEGTSIVLNSVFRVDPGSRSICERLMSAVGHRVQANVYLTPPSARAFSTHYDTHDVIVVQLHGSKEWNLYERPPSLARLPRRADRSLQPSELEVGTCTKVALARGSVLYLPRGFPHRARATEEPSIHITFSLDPVSWGQVLRMVLDILEDKDERLREHVSPDLFRAPFVSISLSGLFDEIATSLREPAHVAAAVATIRKRAFETAVLTPAASLDPVLRDGTRIRWRSEVFHELQRQSDGSVVVSNGIKAIRLSPSEAEVLARLIAGDEVRGDSLSSDRGQEARQAILRLTALGLAQVSGTT